MKMKVFRSTEASPKLSEARWVFRSCSQVQGARTDRHRQGMPEEACTQVVGAAGRFGEALFFARGLC